MSEVSGPQLPDDYDEPEPPPEDAVPLPLRLNAWRKNSATGAMLAGSLFGLQKVFEDKERDEIVMEVDDPGDPEDDPVALDLDPFDPAASTALLRPWLLDDDLALPPPRGDE